MNRLASGTKHKLLGAPAVQGEVRAARTAAPTPTIRRSLLIALFLFLLGYGALFSLLQSASLWQIYSPLQDSWPEIFGWLNTIFPASEQRTDADIGPGLVALGLYLLVLVWLFGTYVYALRLASKRLRMGAKHRATLHLILAGTAAMLALVFFTREIFAVDVFAYSWFGRIWAIFGANPYSHVPSEFASQDAANWLPYLYWRDLPSPYGPLWLMLAGGVAQLARFGNGDIVYSVVGHKLLADAVHLANIALIWRIAGIIWPPVKAMPGQGLGVNGSRRGRRWIRPGSTGTNRAQLFATVAYAWNPLFIIEFGISGHNDLLMLTPVLLALLLHLKGHWRLAVLALTLACLVKFTAIIFLPGYLWLLYWQTPGDVAGGRLGKGMSRVAQALLIFLATFAAFYIPFWQGPSTLNVLYDDPSARFFVHSLSTIANRKLPEILSGLAALLGQGNNPAWSPAALALPAGNLSRGIPLAITALVALWQTWRARTFNAMIAAWGWTIFTLLTVGLSWYWPWYASWLVVPAVLSGRKVLVRATVLLSFTSLLIYCVGIPLKSVWPDARLWVGLPVMGIPLLYVAISYWRSGELRPHARVRGPSLEIAPAKRLEGSS